MNDRDPTNHDGPHNYVHGQFHAHVVELKDKEIATLRAQRDEAEAVLHRIADPSDLSEGPNMAGRLALRAALFQRFAREYLATTEER